MVFRVGTPYIEILEAAKEGGVDLVMLALRKAPALRNRATPFTEN